MKKSANYAGYITQLILALIISLPVHAQFAGGDGSPENPYQIENEDQLNEIRNFLDSHFILISGIELSDFWGPIGSSSAPFTGSLNGNNFPIQKVSIANASVDPTGFFEQTDGATISNIIMIVDNIVGEEGVYVGSLIGLSNNTTIESVTVLANSSRSEIAGESNVGGLVGSARSTVISNSSARGLNVNAGSNAGGIVGEAISSIITDSFASKVNVSAFGDAGGGIGSFESSTVIDSYATGDVDGTSSVGGFIGSITGTNEEPSVSRNSYAAGFVNVNGETTTVGAFAGSDGGRNVSTCESSTIIENSAFGFETTGRNVGVGSATGSPILDCPYQGLNGLSQEQMQQESSFPALDFENDWQINEGSSYPYLQDNPQDPAPFVEVIPVFAGGDGSVGNPYRIEFARQLNNIRDFPDANFELINDIDLNTFPFFLDEGWNPIGTAQGFPQVPFTGTIDGNGFTISNLYIESNSSYNSLLGDTENCTVTDLNFESASISGNQFIGILASQSEGCSFENISINDAGLDALPKAFNVESDSLKNRVSGTAFVGGLVGYAVSTSFDNIFVEAFVENTGSSTGGIVGVMLTSSSLTNSASAGVVEGGNNGSGGLVGENLSSSLISQSYSTSVVTGGNLYTGGLVGNNNNSARITNSYALGKVTGSNQVGGLAGRNNAGVDSSYSAGQVIGVTSVGGLVGSNNGQTNNSFWNVETAGIGISIAGTGFTDESIKTQDSLSSLIDFTSIWTIDEGTSFPYLQLNTPLTPPSLEIPQIFAGGSGSMSDPFQISTIDHLRSARNFPDSYFSLLNNLSFNPSTDFIDETGWVPIGSFEFPFTKGFNGNGHTISKVFIDRQFLNNQGLFGYVDGASISNLNLDSLEVSGQMFVGGLAGSIKDATVENVTVSGSVLGFSEVGILIGIQENSSTSQSISHGSVLGQNRLGGLIGSSNDSSSTTNSSSSAYVSGSSSIGGLIGYNHTSDVSQSYSTAEVIGTSGGAGGLIGRNISSEISENYYAGDVVTGNFDVGGLIGSNESQSTVINNYSIGAVEGINSVGGFVGETSSSELTNNYSAGTVTGEDETGGFAGEIAGTTLDNLFWNIQTAGSDVGENATGLLNAEFKNQSSFIGFDFGSTWQIDENSSFPYLQNNAQNPSPVLDIPAFFAGGAGTEGDPYLVGTLEHLNNVRRFLNSWYQQISDIDMNVMPFNVGEGWNPIGSSELRFKGEFNGDRFTIKNLFISRPNTNHVGLFGYADSSTISNVHLQEVNILGDNFTGALVGLLETSVLDSSSSSGNVNGAQRVGGLIGQTESTLISNSSSSANVNAGNITGGLVGYHGRLSSSTSDAVISNSYSTGSVDGNSWVGGLVAIVSRAHVTNSYSTSAVEGDGIVAGLVGENTSDAILENVYSSGSVTGNTNVGGLIGRDLATLNGGWWNTESSGQATSDGGTGLTDAEMRMEASFAGFDFSNTWSISESITFPFLQGNIQNPGPGIPVVSVGIVTLTSPENNSVNEPTELNLEWESASQAVTYHVQLSGNNDFTSIISQDEEVDGLSFELSGLENETTYYWRVRGENEFGFGDWSSAWSFTTTGLPPSLVELISPSDTETDVETSPLFIWQSTASATSYSLQLSSSSDFIDLVLDEVAISDTTLQLLSEENSQKRLNESNFQSTVLDGLTTYYWRVRASNDFGEGDWSNVWSFTTQVATSDETNPDLPSDVKLLQNYPNPFNPTTQIEFQLPDNALVSLNVYDMLGRRISTLVNQQMQAGYHSVSFNATNLSSGVYIYQLRIGNRIFNRKMMLIK